MIINPDSLHRIAIEHRLVEGNYSRLPAWATDLVRRQVNLIAALAAPATLPAKAATTTIPIAFLTGSFRFFLAAQRNVEDSLLSEGIPVSPAAQSRPGSVHFNRSRETTRSSSRATY
jgi:hypothetical protein